MKCIKVGNQIASLENVLDVGIGSCCDSIRITYKDGYIISSSNAFAHHSTQLRYVKDVDKVMQEIFQILSE
jgi:hypothetical protein